MLCGVTATADPQSGQVGSLSAFDRHSRDHCELSRGWGHLGIKQVESSLKPPTGGGEFRPVKPEKRARGTGVSVACRRIEKERPHVHETKD